MNVREEYVEYATKIIHKMAPSMKRPKLEKIISRIVKEKATDPTITMDNNVTGDNSTITLSKLCGWIEREKPVISGNATFYCQPSVLKSPTSTMLRTLKKERKSIKSQMFKALQAMEFDLYSQLDLAQLNTKVIMNAEYGGSGTPTAAFYTKYSPAATTLMAQSIITTMAAFFESYVGDNQKFFSINEFFDWATIVLKKDFKIPSWIVRPTRSQLAQRIKQHFMYGYPPAFRAIDIFVEGCSEDELVYLYYANNLKGFVGNHPNIQVMIHNVLTLLPNYEAAVGEVPESFKSQFERIDEYNKWISKEMFLNPYAIPDVIKDIMEQFITMVNKYVFVEYITPDSIVKLNNHFRNTVLLVDTDSNIINADLFVAYVLDVLFPGETFGRKKMYNEMILVNVLAATLDRSVANMLDYYGRMHNMDDDARAELTMKNEFMFRRFFLLAKKKRYIASILLLE